MAGMNRHHVYRPETKKQEPVLIERYMKRITICIKIVGIIDDHYIVKTLRGLKEVKIDMRNKKKINDEIKIEKL